jgi:cell division protein FtsW
MKRTGFEPYLLVLVTLALVAFGLVMVFSATSAPAALGNGNPMSYVEKQGVYAFLGITAMLVLRRIDYRRLRALAPALVVAALVLCLGVLAVGTKVNGARRWIEVGPVQFQPSEIAKLALAIWTAAYLARRRPPHTLKELAKPVGLIVGVFAALILVEPDMGTVIAIVLMVVTMLLVAGTPVRVLGVGTALVLGLGVAAIWFEPYRRSRFFAFLNPWHDPQGAGFQIVQAEIGMGSGGLFGAGLGQGVAKIHYLPEAHTDMIFAVIGEELGFIGAFALICAYAVFGYAGFRISLACKDPFGKRLAAGLTALVCGQAAINLAAVLGVAPLTGIPLPFISYGGSSLVVLLATVGVLLNIGASDVRQARPAEVPDRSRGNVRPRPAVAGGGRGAAREGGDGDLRRVAGSRRGTTRP